jgi:hypothetical protein
MLSEFQLSDLFHQVLDIKYEIYRMAARSSRLLVEALCHLAIK